MSIKVMQKLLRPLARRVMLMVSRGVVQVVDDALRLQALQVSLLADELVDGVEHFQPYGLAAHPFAGAECIFLAVGGSRDHGVVVAVSDRERRPTALDEGDVALYNGEGIGVRLDGAGDVHVGGREVETFAARADRVDTRIAALETSVSALVAAFNAHTHAGVTFGLDVSLPPITPATPPAPGAPTAADKTRIV